MISTGKFGQYGGIYVPETLMPALEQLEEQFIKFQKDEKSLAQYKELSTKYAGRPTPLYYARNISKAWGAKIYLKREDLLHGGAHKTNNALGQALLAKTMGKARIIAETGAGQHGVAVAMAGALLGLKTEVYMGEIDIERQQSNVQRMEIMGCKLHPVKTGSRTLKDAINDALRDWITNLEDTHYLMGTAAGPHPFPAIVKYFQRIIGDEARSQFMTDYGGSPNYVIACVGGGSNAIGTFTAFIDDKEVKLIGVEPAGDGLDTKRHGAVLAKGTEGCLHGMKSKIMQNVDGQILEAHSVAAGLDYPSVGPEHAYLQDIGRASYVAIEDKEAIAAFHELSSSEGIIPALESAHALAYAKKLAKQVDKSISILVNLSGRGDKDLAEVKKYAK